MRRFACLALLLCLAALSACDVPAPPPELPTPTPGSQNPESPLTSFGLTPVAPTRERGYSPLAAAPGHIYFVRDSGLWRIAPDGSEETQLSDRPVSSPPQPSPDGKLVAFTSGKSLFVVPSTGGEAREVASGELIEGQRLGWTPDSLLVGYVTYDASTLGSQAAWVVPVTGGASQAITTLAQAAVGRGPTYESSVQWSPDGKWVVVGGANNPMRLLRWPLSSGQPNDVRAIAGGEPDWTPNSHDLIYSETLNGALVTYDVVRSGPTPFRDEEQYVGTGMGEYAQGPRPRWSPASIGEDSDLIAYRSRSPEGEPRVGVRRRGGHDVSPLPSLTNSPGWSPGGDRLVVETGAVKQDPLGPQWLPTGLSIARIDPLGNHTLAPLVKDGRRPVWGK